MTFKLIRETIQKGKFAPVYALHGTEPYFIDQLTDLIESKVVDPGMKSFNQEILYGAEATAGRLNSALRSFPVMSNYRLVILKEAQKMKAKEWEGILAYLANPLSSTVFVIAHKEKKFDSRTKLGKLLTTGKGFIAFESKPVYENQLPDVVRDMLERHGIEADPDCYDLFLECYGTNISLIEKEIEKLTIQLNFLKQKKLTRKFMYEYVNIDREFNVFELQNALGSHNFYKSWQIMDSMMQNAKDNPPVVVLSNLFSFFNKLAVCKYAGASNENDIAQVLGIKPFMARDYKPALRHYSMTKIKDNLVQIAEADLVLKGITQSRLDKEFFMRNLIQKLF